jgi:hypothetical protein
MKSSTDILGDISLKALMRLLFERFKFTRLVKARKVKDIVSLGVLEQVNMNGFAVIEDFLDIAECSLIRQEIDSIIDSEKSTVQWDQTLTDGRIIGAENLSQAINKFHKDSRLIAISRAFYGEKIIHFFTMAARLRFNGENFGSGNGWHRDSFSPQLKMMLYLGDVEGLNGPFQYVRHSHTLTHMLRFNIFVGQSELSKRYRSQDVNLFCQNQSGQDVAEFTARAGTLILFDASGLHRGSPILKDDRYALTIYSMRSRSINAAKYKKFGLTKS